MLDDAEHEELVILVGLHAGREIGNRPLRPPVDIPSPAFSVAASTSRLVLDYRRALSRQPARRLDELRCAGNPLPAEPSSPR